MLALRKFIALILICLLTFNWFGYRLLLHYMESRSNIALQEKLDNLQYDPRSLVEVRVPLNMPYISDWKDFENYAGETTIDGMQYRYVKRKLEKGELVLLCLPNQNGDKLQKVGNEFFKQVNDIPATEKKSKPPLKVTKATGNEFTCVDMHGPLGFDLTDPRAVSIYKLFFSSFTPPTPAQPPNC
jgi:hypothetical protein